MLKLAARSAEDWYKKYPINRANVKIVRIKILTSLQLHNNTTKKLKVRKDPMDKIAQENVKCMNSIISQALELYPPYGPYGKYRYRSCGFSGGLANDRTVYSEENRSGDLSIR